MVDHDFEVWARLNTPALYRRALMLTGERSQAQDLVQDTLIKMYTRWGSVDAKAHPVAYAKTILYNRFVSNRRRHRREVLTDAVPEPATSLTDAPGDSDMRLDVAALLADLPPRDRCVLIARYLDDLSVDEVGQILHRPPSWVKSTSHRAIARLRSRYGHDLPDLLVR